MRVAPLYCPSTIPDQRQRGPLGPLCLTPWGVYIGCEGEDYHDLLTEERRESTAEPVQSRRRYSRIPGKAGAGPTIIQRDELDF